jgi:hypothetical protein
MLPLTRRNFAGACVAAGALGPLEALARTVSSPAAEASAARPPVVDLVGDGVPLSPAEYATLLARLTRGGLAADEYSRGGAVEAMEAQFAKLLGTEAAVFMPTGTLANHLAVRALSIESPVRRLKNQAFDFAEMERVSKEARSSRAARPSSPRCTTRGACSAAPSGTPGRTRPSPPTTPRATSTASAAPSRWPTT